MRKILKSISCLSAAIVVGCSGGSGTLAPDNICVIDDNNIAVASRAANEVVIVDVKSGDIKTRTKTTAPVNDILVTDGTIWAVSDGNKGELIELDGNLKTKSSTPMGHTPSAIVANKQSGNLWITQRYNNEIWEVNPSTKEVVARVAVGREPVDVITFNSDSLLLVANNLPEGSALDFPVAARLDIVDANGKNVINRIVLPNGSTDVKSVATDKDKRFAYVTHLIGRYQIPTNQVDRGWMMTNAMSVIDLDSCKLVTSVLLDTPQKGAANPWQVIVTDDNKAIAVALSGVHEVAYIDRDSLHSRIDRAKAGEKVVPSLNKFEDIVNDAGFLYGIREFIPTNGNGPRAIAQVGDKIYAGNYFTGEIVSLTSDRNSATQVLKGNALAATSVGEGEMYFHDAAIGFQEWQSCASCHPNGARVDGLNWDLLNDGAGSLKNTKTLMYSHVTPPCMITGIRKDATTAVRSGIKYILFAQVDNSIPEALDTYLKSLRPVPSPYLKDGQLSEAAARGKESFDKNCAMCHNGEYYTDMKMYPVSWATGKEEGIEMDVPALTEVWRTAPYLYDGRSYTMREMLNVHGPQETLNDSQLNDLAEYVLSL